MLIKKKDGRTVVVTKSGSELTVMERPEGPGTFEDYVKEVEKIREQYADLLNKQSFDDFLKARHEAAAREWEG